MWGTPLAETNDVGVSQMKAGREANVSHPLTIQERAAAMLKTVRH